MKKHNLHTHTIYSDGTLHPKQLVEIAKDKNIEIIGISDHAFSKKLSSEYQITSRLEQYLNHLRKIQNSSNSIDVKIGIEIDASQRCGIDPSQLPFDILNKFNYILFEYVNTVNEYFSYVGNRDISEIINIRNKLEVPVGLAHNDLQQNYDGKEKEIASILADNDIFIELNKGEFHPQRKVGRNTRDDLNYYQHFSKELLEQLVKKDVKVVAGTDSHDRESLTDLDEVYSFIKDNNLSYHKIVL